MVATDRLFAGSIPEIYDRYLVPMIFEPYALDLAGRIARAKPRTILETAAGTGALTWAIAAQLPAGATLLATDLNQPMLDRAMARQLSDGRPDDRIAWRQADALALPFGAQSFDVVACQFGAMFFPDRAVGFSEARRLLRPGGHLMFNVWGRISENEFPQVIMDALAELFPDDPPRFMARLPHGYFDPDAIRADLNAAGFTEIAIEVVDKISRAPSALDAAIAYCQGTPWRSEIEAQGASGLEAATRRAADALARRFGRGAIEGRIRALVVTAVR